MGNGAEFEEVMLQYTPELCDEYRGTSPRKLVPGTQVGGTQVGQANAWARYKI